MLVCLTEIKYFENVLDTRWGQTNENFLSFFLYSGQEADRSLIILIYMIDFSSFRHLPQQNQIQIDVQKRSNQNHPKDALSSRCERTTTQKRTT